MKDNPEKIINFESVTIMARAYKDVRLARSRLNCLFIHLFNIKLVQQYTRKEKEKKTKKKTTVEYA